jgi:hypothetical protein
MNNTTSIERFFLPAAILVLALTLLGVTGFQCYMLVQGRQELQTTRSNQERPLSEATAFRRRVEGLAGRVAELADEGNPDARMIIENFRRQGIELHRPAGAAEAPPPPKP